MKGGMPSPDDPAPSQGTQVILDPSKGLVLGKEKQLRVAAGQLEAGGGIPTSGPMMKDLEASLGTARSHTLPV